MKKGKFKLILQGMALGACLAPCAVTFAAQQETVWGKAEDYSSSLAKFAVGDPDSPSKHMQYAPNYGSRKNHVHTFQFDAGLIDDSKVSHTRYNQFYNGLPVWQSQVVYHVSRSDTSVTGSLIKGIDQDVQSLDPAITTDQATKIALGDKVISNPVNVEKVIYFNPDKNVKALLAYHVSYMLSNDEERSLPSFIIDANTGNVLEQWDALPNITNGQGLGGVNVDNPNTHPGKYQYGNSVPGLNQLGPLSVKDMKNGICMISNPQFRVFNLKNIPESQLGFGLPVSSVNEKRLTPFVFNCAGGNMNDNGYSPVNSGISPVNDVTYFLRHTINMLKNEYGVASPIGTEIPFPVYTHIGNYDNASACGPSCIKASGVAGPQQMFFGNGQTMFYPLTEGDVVAHEFGHLVTEHFSNLTYIGQSGAINEAFSDMTGMALNNHLRSIGYTWYWDGKDWSTGKSITKNGMPLRYFDNPAQDKVSIDHASKYMPGMNVHLASGVYNKAFYLLSTTTGWSLEKAYQVMLDANMKYWTPTTDFNTGSCGVRDAAVARGYSAQDVVNAFKQVGVVCLKPISV